MQKSTLLATKLHQPALPARWVERPHLSERLYEGLERGRQLTLVSAPAGFGKTTCICAWADALEGWQITWLSLEPADDDPGRFLAYLVAALQKIDANQGQDLEGAIRAGQLPPVDVIGTTLVNDMSALDDRFVLVLDDFHHIQDPVILQLLEQIIANLPRQLHLVLLTREDPPLPLARLRANNLLTEIRARDLRFSGGDSDRFLNEAMNLSLSRADVALLEAKTEGWIAGLQLAAIAMRALQWLPGTQAEPSKFIATLSGSHRFILSYLTEQVLDRQPEAIRRFLLETSILDRLSGDLCNAVTGRTDGEALLQRLLNANLFLIPLDDERRWYRFHHLFADLLRELQNTLPQNDVADLHRRAGHWYAGEAALRSKERSVFVSEAIRHALAASDYALAVNLLEEHAMTIIMQGYARTVGGWVQALPEAWRAQSPRTDLAFAWMHLLRGEYALAEPYLERAHTALTAFKEGEAKASLQAEWRVMRSLVLQMEDRPAQSEKLAREALEMAPEGDGHVRSLAYFALGSALRSREAYAPAVDAYRLSIQRGRAAENSVAEMLSTVGLTSMAFEHGQLHLAFEIADPVIARLEESGGLPPISSVIFGVLGDVHYQWHRLKEARRYSRRALQLSTLGGYKSGLIICSVLLCRLAQIEGDLEGAAHELRQVDDLVPARLPDYVRQELIAQQVRVYLARHQPGLARLALQGEGLFDGQGTTDGRAFTLAAAGAIPVFPGGRPLTHAAGLLYNSSLRLLLYEARAGGDGGRLRRGVELADGLIAGATESRLLLVALEALLLRAQMYDALGGARAEQAEGECAEADYVRALEAAEPEGIVTAFVEQGRPVAEALGKLLRAKRVGGVELAHVEHVLAAFSQAESGAPVTSLGEQPEALIEPLTDRELEVVALMAEGLKYKEIGEELFISLNTVRFHVKAIYGKLGVNNRTQAVETARQLRIL